jgi:hypothetical protein
VDRRPPLRRGAAPLPQARALAPLLRRVAGLALALEAEDPALAELIEQLKAADKALSAQLPADLRPRMTETARLPESTRIQESTGDRVYLDHSHDIGAYNPCFPEYEVTVDGDRAIGTVEFPLAFEGPPGLVHGGALSLFFDAVIQQHNCELGIAGKTVSLHVDYRRPTPLLRPLEFAVEHAVDGSRSTSTARLYSGAKECCTATVVAVAADVSRLPGVAPRRTGP